MFLKSSAGPKQGGSFFLNESESRITHDGVWQFLAMKLIQFGLGIKQVDLARRSFHEEKNAAPRFWGKMWRLDLAGPGKRNRLGQERVLLKKRGQRQCSQSACCGSEKTPTGIADPFFVGI